MRCERKAALLTRLQRGPLRTRELLAMFPGARKGAAITSMYWLRDCGAVKARKVRRDNRRGGPRMTTEWSLYGDACIGGGEGNRNGT